MSSTAALVAAVLAAVLGPLIAYITATRRLSGKIGTSEASQLWEESKSIRDDYRERITTNDTRTAALEGRVAVLEKLNNELTRENVNLLTAGAGNEATIAELRARVEVLEAENADLHEQIAALQKSLGREKP